MIQILLADDHIVVRRGLRALLESRPDFQICGEASNGREAVDMAIANLVREGKTHQIPGMIQVGKKKGNQPLDDAVMDHLRQMRISPEEAYDSRSTRRSFAPSSRLRLRRSSKSRIFRP